MNTIPVQRVPWSGSAAGSDTGPPPEMRRLVQWGRQWLNLHDGKKEVRMCVFIFWLTVNHYIKNGQQDCFCARAKAAVWQWELQSGSPRRSDTQPGLMPFVFDCDLYFVALLKNILLLDFYVFEQFQRKPTTMTSLTSLTTNRLCGNDSDSPASKRVRSCDRIPQGRSAQNATIILIPFFSIHVNGLTIWSLRLNQLNQTDKKVII